MMELSYRRHRFPPVVIQHAVWLYLRFTLTYRDIEDLPLAERGFDVSYETVRSWVLKFGPVIGRDDFHAGAGQADVARMMTRTVRRSPSRDLWQSP